MHKMFFYGTLQDLDLRSAVLGHEGADLKVCPAALLDFEVLNVPEYDIPYAQKCIGRKATGVLVSGLSDEDKARLSYYESSFDYKLHDFVVQSGADNLVLPVYLPPKTDWHLDGAWNLETWQKRNNGLNAQAALEIMDSFGHRDAVEVGKDYAGILFRALARVASRDASPPQKLRNKATPTDVELIAKRRPYAKYFAVEEFDLKIRRYDGTFSEKIERAVFVSGDAVTVVPYDPVNDLVMLIEQFRAAPYARGDRNPWTLEPIAGRRDPGESYEETARREAFEEANVKIDALELIGNYYPSPGCYSEYLYSYIGIANLSKDREGVHGLQSEDEDIRSLVIPLSDLLDAVRSGEVDTAPLLISAFWLDQNSERLRKQHASA